MKAFRQERCGRVLLLVAWGVCGAVRSGLAGELAVGPGQPFTRIQDAIDAASDGDSVLVREGTYPEAIDFKGKKIRVASVSGAATTTIDASSLRAPLPGTILRTPVGYLLELHLRRQYQYPEGGAVFGRASNPAAIVKFYYCTFYANTAGRGAGGFLQSRSPLIDQGSEGTDPEGKPPALWKDFDGNSRFTDGDGDGKSAPDLGAFELGVAGTPFRRGDANDDGQVDVSDTVTILNYQFLAGERPKCLDAADADDTGIIDLSDPILILNYLFLAGRLPDWPGPTDCGFDPDQDTLAACASSRC